MYNNHFKQNIDNLCNIIYNMYIDGDGEEQSFVVSRTEELYRAILKDNSSVVLDDKNDEYKLNNEEKNRYELLMRYFGTDYKKKLIEYGDVGAVILGEFMTPSQNNLDLAIFKVRSYSYSNFTITIYANYSTIFNTIDITVSSDQFLKYFMERRTESKELLNNYYIAMINLDDINKSYFTSLTFNDMGIINNLYIVKSNRKNEIERFLGKGYTEKLSNIPKICLEEYYEYTRDLYPYKIITLNPILKEALVTIYIKGTPITILIDFNEIININKSLVYMVNTNKYYGCFICNKENAIDMKCIDEGIIYFTDAEYNMKVDISDEQ